MAPAFNLDSIVLKRGSHASLEDGGCIMEWTARFAGEPHSDRPSCVSSVIGDFLRNLNDALGYDERQRLKPLIPKLIGTAGTPEQELRRAYLVLDWYCRVSPPAWLRWAGMIAEAEAIEQTAPIVDPASAREVQAALEAASQATTVAARAAWAAGDTGVAVAEAGLAAYAAARVAARAASGDLDATKLRPSARALQQSALELVERMIRVSED